MQKLSHLATKSILLHISVTNTKQLNSGDNQKCPKTAARS